MNKKKKKTDIVLIELPPWGVHVPPLGIASLSSYMKHHGYSVAVYDLNIELFHTGRARELWQFKNKDVWNDPAQFSDVADMFNDALDAMMHVVVEKEPVLVGLSVTQNSILCALEVASRLKKLLPQTVIVAGGWASFNEHERIILFRDGVIDICVIGEGEETLHELTAILKSNQDIGVLNDISGCIRASGSVQQYMPRRRIDPLDAIPFPTYEEFDLSRYYIDGDRCISLLMGRGCIGRCVFCNDRIYQGRLRVRSPERIVNEMTYHCGRYGVHHFVFNDLLINGDLNHLERVCDLIIAQKLMCRWEAQFVVQKDIPQRIFSKLKDAGCSALQLGIESGSNDILGKMGKRFTAEDAEAVMHSLIDVGIQTWVNFIVGFPGETDEDFNKTVSFIKRNKENITRVMVVNTCNVVFSSQLMNDQEHFGIILSEKPELLEISWRTADGNCDQLRKSRLEKLMEHIHSLNIPIGQSNAQIKLTE